jgi:sugar phosphate isomerase/epimerase
LRLTWFSLAHLTVLDLPPPEMVRVAARTGYRSVGLRLIAATDTSPGYPLMRDTAMFRETKSALAETGIQVLDLEFVKITPEIDVAGLEAFVAVGAELGARYVITSPYDPDLTRLADRLAAIGALCARHGLRALLEFFPWTVVPDLSAAERMVQACGRADVGILVDTLHFNRSGSTLEQLDRIPPERLPFVHVADAPVQDSYTTEDLLHAGRAERLPPGEGQIDIASILRHMPADIPIALEVPMTARSAAEGSEAVARRVRLAAEGLRTGG